MSKPVNRDTERTRDLRERLLALMIRVFAVTGGIAYFPSAYLSIVSGLWVIFIADTLAFGYVICLALIPRIGYTIKIVSVAVLMYCLGLALIVFTGPFGAGHLFIFCFVFIAALFGEIKTIVLANLLAVLTHIGFGLSVAAGLLSWDQDIESVIVISVNFVLVSVVLSFAANYLITGFAGTAAEEKRLRKMLEMMLMEIEHRVKNNLQVISSLISMRSREPADPRRALDDIKESLSAISVVHQLLYRRNSLYLVKPGALIGLLTERFKKVHKDIRFSFTKTGPETEVDSDIAVSIGILVTEVVMNSVKHAFPTSADAENQDATETQLQDAAQPALDADPTISIAVSFDAEKNLFELVIADNGAGMPAEPVPGHGLKIITALCRQLNADIRQDSSSGLTYRFSMNLESAPAAVALSN